MQKSGIFLLLFLTVVVMPLFAYSEDVPVIVRQGSSDTPFANDHQIVRTSSGKLYYINGNAGSPSILEGWIEIATSSDGIGWTSAGRREQWQSSSSIGVAVDSHDILHLLTFDWSNRPVYTMFNSIDSPKGDHSWEVTESLETAKSAADGRSVIAIDANDNPHIVYTLQEKYRGKIYTTLTYAVKVGGVWQKTVIWPKEGKISFNGKFDIAIGPDNIPYIMAGSRIFKGNRGIARNFETKELGAACYSMVMHENGDLRAAFSQNGNYANYLHDHREAWGNGWELLTSSTPDNGGILLLINDRPYVARLLDDGIWLQRDFEQPLMVVRQPYGVTWQSLTGRWSRTNQAVPGYIDLGTRSWNSQGGNQF